MKNLRRFLVAGSVAAAINSSAAAQVPETTSPSTGAHDFDFLVGEWRVHHYRLKPNSQEWVDFEGTCTNHKLMDGGANMEEHSLNAPYGAYHAVALRAYDPKTGQWAIWWLDGRYPSGPLDPPVKGRFENGVGTFYSDYTQDGKPMRVRLVEHHTDIRSLGTVSFIRRRKELGNKLDHEFQPRYRQPRARCRDAE